jgi:hypothetical protein
MNCSPTLLRSAGSTSISPAIISGGRRTASEHPGFGRCTSTPTGSPHDVLILSAKRIFLPVLWRHPYQLKSMRSCPGTWCSRSGGILVSG